MDKKLNFLLTSREAAFVQYALFDLKDKLVSYEKLMSSKGMRCVKSADGMRENAEDIKTVQELIERLGNITGIRI